MIELQDILVQHGDAYLSNHGLFPNQRKAMGAIRTCRTSALGGHIDECDKCDYISISYNSCRNRHCPKCQTINKERWIAARKWVGSSTCSPGVRLRRCVATA